MSAFETTPKRARTEDAAPEQPGAVAEMLADLDRAADVLRAESNDVKIKMEAMDTIMRMTYDDDPSLDAPVIPAVCRQAAEHTLVSLFANAPREMCTYIDNGPELFSETVQILFRTIEHLKSAVGPSERVV